MHESTIEEVIRSSIWINLVKAPSWLALGVRSNDRDRKKILKVFYVSDKIDAVGKGAEETCFRLSAP